jgi:hypothetical protein
MRSNVAKIGEIAFLDINILLRDIVFRVLFVLVDGYWFHYITRMKPESTSRISRVVPDFRFQQSP